MRYQSGKDTLIKIAIWGAVFVFIISVAVSPSVVRPWGVLLAAIGSGFVLWIYYGTYYEFLEDHLYARSGPFVERIYYHSIVEATICKNFYSSMALSSERIFIRTTRKGLMGMTYISPVQREEFLAELKTKLQQEEAGRPPKADR